MGIDSLLQSASSGRTAGFGTCVGFIFLPWRLVLDLQFLPCHVNMHHLLAGKVITAAVLGRFYF